MVEDTGTWDKIKGKTNQAVGDITDNKSQELKGHAQEAKGDAKSALRDKEEREDRTF